MRLIDLASSNRPARGMLARRAVALSLFMLGCAGSSLTETTGSDVHVVALNVAEKAVSATLERGQARITFEAERGDPFDAETASRMDPEENPPGGSATILLDRRGHVISMAGLSFKDPAKWQALLDVTPTRTQQELDEDLALAASLPDLLLKDERVRKWFRWEARSLRGRVKSLQSAKP